MSYQEQNHSLQKLSYVNNLLDNMNEILYTYDMAGFITFINKKSYDMLGFSPEEVIGKHLGDFVPERYRKRFILGLEQRIKEGKRDSYVLTVTHKNGSEKIIRLNVSPIIENCQFIGEMVLADDITEQRKAEKELKRYNQNLEAVSQELRAINEQLMATEEELRQQLEESEKNKDALADAHQKLEVLFDFLPDPAFAIDQEGQVTMWNRAMEELTGIKIRDILGKSNCEYAIPFYGKRRPLPIDLVLSDSNEAQKYYKNISFNNDTIFTEEYCPQLGVNGTYLSSKSSPLLDRKGCIMGAIQITRDISELKAKEDAIRESEEKYRNIIQSIEDGYFEVDISGNFNFFNRYLHQSVGYSANEMMGMSYRKVMDGENGEKVLRAFNRVYTTGKPVKEFGWYVTRKDGSKMFVESTILPIRNNGEIIGFRGLIRDISERKKAEEALQNSETNLQKQVKYLNTLINNLNEMFITYDLQGQISFVNRRSYDVLGYFPDEVLGKKVADFIVKEHKYLVLQAIQERLTNGGESSYELPLIHKDGKTRIIKLNASPIVDEKGTITGGMVLAEDVTASKMAEEQLRFSEARYRAIVEDQTELICRFLPNGSITFVNLAYCRYFSQEKNLVYGTNFIDIVYTDDKDMVRKCIGSLSPRSPVKAIEHRIQMPDGTVRWQHWTHRAIFNDHGTLIDYQSVGSDITERKLAEDQLKYLSRHDTLTGLFNRFHFEEQMKYFEHSQAAPMGLIMCDVDGLKLVNDTLGHDEGDELLRAVAHVISRSFRKNDIVARVGGDEFAILLPASKRRVVESAVNRIKESIRLYNQEHPKVPLSISMGCAVRYDTNVTMLELYQEADNNMYREKLHSGQSARSSIVHTLMKALEARDFITEGHGDRLQSLVEIMGKSLNLTNQRINDLKLLAQFHDIGKVGVPDSILFKQGPLTVEEYAIMKRHSEIGHRIALSAPELMLIADWILKHHEWWNGKGYPLGLSGEAIPLECRILAIADAYDSMTNDRPYRRAMSHQQAIKELLSNAGRQFDPLLAKRFVTMVEEWWENDSVQ